MKCWNPLVLKNEDGTGKTVPCGKCYACLQNKRNEWTFRISEELRLANAAHFVTLTYDQENLPFGGNLSKRDLQLFLKVFRKHNKLRGSPSIRYYAVGEYGSKKGRPHYHIILFNADHKMIDNISKYWKKGTCYVGSVTMASIHYVTKYSINRKRNFKGRVKEFAIMSRKPGIGSNYLRNADIKRKNLKNVVYFQGGFKMQMPRFYKDKIFDDDMKEFIKERFYEDYFEEILEDHYNKDFYDFEKENEERNILVYNFNKRDKSKF